MNIVLDNIIYSKEKQGGVSNYFYEITSYMNQFEETKIKYYEERGAELNGCRQKLIINNGDIIPHKNKNLFLARLSPIQYKSNDFFLYHSSFYRPLLGSKNYKEITTIYDFVHDRYASFSKRVVHNKLKYGAIKRADGIICISHNTYNDLIKFCPPKESKKIEVIHCGVSKDYFPLTENQITLNGLSKETFFDNDFLLFVGSRASYKNFDFVISLLKETQGLQLVVVGRPFSENELKYIGSSLLPRIKVISGVDNDGLNVLYNKALALIYPSDYEGFGIPVIEAMQAACPVLALNKSSIPEVAGDAGLLFDSLKISEFKEKIALLSEHDFRNHTIEKGLLQAQKFSWEKCSKETMDFYKEIYK